MADEEMSGMRSFISGVGQELAHALAIGGELDVGLDMAERRLALLREHSELLSGVVRGRHPLQVLYFAGGIATDYTAEADGLFAMDDEGYGMGWLILPNKHEDDERVRFWAGLPPFAVNDKAPELYKVLTGTDSWDGLAENYRLAGFHVPRRLYEIIVEVIERSWVVLLPQTEGHPRGTSGRTAPVEMLNGGIGHVCTGEQSIPLVAGIWPSSARDIATAWSMWSNTDIGKHPWQLDLGGRLNVVCDTLEKMLEDYAGLLKSGRPEHVLSFAKQFGCLDISGEPSVLGWWRPTATQLGEEDKYVWSWKQGDESVPPEPVLIVEVRMRSPNGSAEWWFRATDADAVRDKVREGTPETISTGVRAKDFCSVLEVAVRPTSEHYETAAQWMSELVEFVPLYYLRGLLEVGGGESIEDGPHNPAWWASLWKLGEYAPEPPEPSEVSEPERESESTTTATATEGVQRVAFPGGYLEYAHERDYVRPDLSVGPMVTGQRAEETLSGRMLMCLVEEGHDDRYYWAVPPGVYHAEHEMRYLAESLAGPGGRAALRANRPPVLEGELDVSGNNGYAVRADRTRWQWCVFRLSSDEWAACVGVERQGQGPTQGPRQGEEATTAERERFIDDHDMAIVQGRYRTPNEYPVEARGHQVIDGRTYLTDEDGVPFMEVSWAPNLRLSYVERRPNERPLSSQEELEQARDHYRRVSGTLQGIHRRNIADEGLGYSGSTSVSGVGDRPSVWRGVPYAEHVTGRYAARRFGATSASIASAGGESERPWPAIQDWMVRGGVLLLLDADEQEQFAVRVVGSRYSAEQIALGDVEDLIERLNAYDHTGAQLANGTTVFEHSNVDVAGREGPEELRQVTLRIIWLNRRGRAEGENDDETGATEGAPQVGEDVPDEAVAWFTPRADTEQPTAYTFRTSRTSADGQIVAYLEQEDRSDARSQSFLPNEALDEVMEMWNQSPETRRAVRRTGAGGYLFLTSEGRVRVSCPGLRGV